MGRADDWILGGALFWILALLVVPLPAVALDMLLALSLTLALLILLVALYTDRPLDFSVFPSLLLVVTLLRLGLNVASTRLILLRGAEGPDAAGRVIESFAQIAIGGNYAVGIILFLIFVTINFVVISKGSGRIAEVAARFMLDSMPGKQMAIDADLNQGVINDSEARTRREELQRESDFYGAMDGASKFVKGDAIAGLLIVAVNVFGGLAIGMAQANMPIGEALETYTALTVGDGLVGQVPALVVSTAAGIVVSRAAGGRPLSDEIKTQMVLQPRALVGTSVMLGALAIAPGFPFAPFAVLAAGTAALARVGLRKAEEQEATPEPVEAPATPAADPASSLDLDDLELEIGYGLIPLVAAERGGDLPARIRALRGQLASQLGFVVPLVHIRDNLELESSQYAVAIRGNRIATGKVPPGRQLAVGGDVESSGLPGIPTQDPAFGLPAVWIQDRDRETAESRGFTVVDPSSAITTHIAETIRSHASELLSRAQVRELLDRYSERAPKVVDEIVPSIVSLSLLHRTLRALLEEHVSVRDIGAILETLAEYAPRIEDPDLLTDLVRERLARTVTSPHLAADGSLHVLTLEPELEQSLAAGVQRSPGGTFLAIEPGPLDGLLRGVQSAIESTTATAQGKGPVLLSTQAIRSPLQKLLARAVPRLSVLSHNELPPDTRVIASGQVRLAHAH
ncbi:MAG: flagellar biosynthesis protein FlhA [Myxococcota bacterium]